MIRKIIIFLAIMFFGDVVSNLLYAKEISNWGTITPNLEKVLPLKSTGNPDDETECLLCHKKYIRAFGKTIHAKIMVSRKGKVLGSACETCHGPMVRHLKGKTRKERNSAVVSFKSLSQRKKNFICLQCHEKGQNMHWRGSTHDRMEVSCSDCHYVMKKRSKKSFFITENANKACYQCHKTEQALAQRNSHMPLREGKMTCSSCHNPHGGIGPSNLKKATVNETCNTCHSEKRGPYLWEHAPVRENCVTCHSPHGSNFPNLLTMKPPYLCQQCHQRGHADFALNSSDFSTNNNRYILGKSCLNCHSLIHGSNHSAGRRFQR